jgi:hypothetical protein
MHRRVANSALSLVLVSALVLAPTRAAFAGSASADATITVWTKDGGMYRGEVVEREPGDHILIKLADGRTKRIEWKDVERDSIGTSTSPEATPEAAPESEPKRTRRTKAAPATEEDGVRVHLQGDPNLRLIRQTGISHVVGSSGGHTIAGTVVSFEVVCYAPCDVVVPRGGDYRVTGEGKRYSAAFALEGESRTIEGHLGSSTGYTAGVWTTIMGASAIAGGALWYVLESSRTPLTTTDYLTGKQTTEPKSYTLAWGFLAVGVVLTTIGIVALATNTNEVKLDGDVLAKTKPRSSFALTPNGFVF